MPTFQSKKFRGAADSNKFAAQYRKLMAKHPFLLFGLPFMTVIVAGSFVLTPATAVRYERHDRRVRQMTRDEELGVGKTGRKVNMKDEYYVGYTSPILRSIWAWPYVASARLGRSLRIRWCSFADSLVLPARRD